jgi:hypothetical protein
MQALDPFSGVYEPAPHALQLYEPSEKLPTGQKEQALDPFCVAYDPAEHPMHVLDPFS